jgi:hypothetical protein
MSDRDRYVRGAHTVLCQPPKLLTPLVAKVIDPPQAYLADYFSPCDEETEGVA